MTTEQNTSLELVADIMHSYMNPTMLEDGDAVKLAIDAAIKRRHWIQDAVFSYSAMSVIIHDIMLMVRNRGQLPELNEAEKTCPNWYVQKYCCENCTYQTDMYVYFYPHNGSNPNVTLACPTCGSVVSL